jgi:ATP-dependent Lon protease
LYGFSLPKGTWMVMMKIENDELWSKIKSGELKGLSIEGYFTNKFEQMQKKEPTTEQILSAFNEIIRENVSPKKTEFSLVSDAKKFLNDYKKSVPKIKSLGDKADNLKSTLLKIDKEVTDAKKIVETEQQTLETEWKELKSLADQMEKIYSNFYDEFKNADRLVDDFIVRSKELGIDPNDSKDYVKLRNAVAESRKITEDASFNIIQWTKKLKNLDY